MARSLDAQEKKFIEQMIAKVEKKDSKPETFKRNDVDIAEVENLTKSIQRRIQQGGK